MAAIALLVLVLSLLRLTPKWLPDALGALSEPRGPIEWVRKRLEQRSTAAV